jgi:hypothetical protein
MENTENKPMEEIRQSRRVTIRLTPWQARRLWQLRTEGLPEGKAPRTVTEILLRAITQPHASAATEDETETRTESPSQSIEATS